MKKIILFLFILIVPTIVMSQTDWYYTRIMKVDSTSSQQLFQKAINWSLNNNIKQPIEKQSYTRICGKGIFDLDYLGTVSYIINIQCVDGKYRYIISDFKHQKKSYEKTDIITGGRIVPIGSCGLVDYSGGNLTNDKPQSNKLTLKDWKEIKEMTQNKTNELIQDLLNKMVKNNYLAKE